MLLRGVVRSAELFSTCSRPATRFPPASFTRPSSSSAALLPTIFAPATGNGKSAISILRISGDDALEVWRRMTVSARGARRTKPAKDPPERRAVLRKIVHPETSEVLDEGVVLYFPAHSALTAQPTLELHLHGSPALMQLLLRLLPTLNNSFRIAEPGEFTRLAFEAGKMDLTEVEGIRDLVEADTESQRKLAARQASGLMREAYDSMRAKAIEATALIEALIDFGEDEGISEGVYQEAKDKVVWLRDRITKYLDDGRRGEIIRSGIHLAIVGPPNAGKSSLLNWLAQREAAIVTAIPGTTRDVVELSLDFHGFPISVADTAGLRSTKDQVEAIGIERAMEKAAVADIKLCVLSVDLLFSSSASNTPIIDPLTLSLIDPHTLILLNKVDSSVPSSAQLEALERALESEGKEWFGKGTSEPFALVSVKEGKGLKELARVMRGELKRRFDLSDDLEETPIVTQERHRRHLEETLTHLKAFLAIPAEDIVDAGEELRYAVLALGKITGAVDVEEVLGEIFRGFCIGK
ncbi:tRNA modification GTPase MSS1, mitochondrial [Rhodotorula toruloides]|uniref:BY PROTMAP: gi/472581348/gb/EMS19087.1/ tRNA modification GTPase [Rhodosporidium toruloides NP11] gi/647395466/emb/CDR36899.1/ RHTO0S02e08306g1_1 [Rhodosporidium toruloides] n=1 Tax=Rhodotorula toruloides TaxID=5286 RepID=A0A0K3CHT8_RHOTO|nr:tRNA modification GTPase MSS1, mitochondrial [Rhodotorula toruloides]PRQ73200.1 tRNA modification GTPase TrmE [Rhodotorula toruloides]